MRTRRFTKAFGLVLLVIVAIQSIAQTQPAGDVDLRLFLEDFEIPPNTCPVVVVALTNNGQMPLQVEEDLVVRLFSKDASGNRTEVTGGKTGIGEKLSKTATPVIEVEVPAEISKSIRWRPTVRGGIVKQIEAQPNRTVFLCETVPLFTEMNGEIQLRAVLAMEGVAVATSHWKRVALR